MKRVIVPEGYTILEIMIFMAATAILFVMAAVAISGRQHAADFLSASRDLQRQIELMASEVTNGFYPSGGVQCTVVGLNLQINSVPGNTQGTNKDCIFMGKVIQFKPNTNNLRVITVAGRRLNAAGNNVKSFAEAIPEVTPLDSSITTNGLHITRVTWKQNPDPVGGPPVPPVDISALGYFIRFPEDLSGSIQEASNVNLIAVQPTNMSFTDAQMNTAIHNMRATANNGNGVNPFEIVVCYEYGGTPGLVQYSTVDRKTYSEVWAGQDRVDLFNFVKQFNYC